MHRHAVFVRDGNPIADVQIIARKMHLPLKHLQPRGPARLNPRPGRTLDRRRSLTVSLRRAMIAKRWEMLRRCRAGTLLQ